MDENDLLENMTERSDQFSKFEINHIYPSPNGKLMFITWSNERFVAYWESDIDQNFGNALFRNRREFELLSKTTRVQTDKRRKYAPSFYLADWYLSLNQIKDLKGIKLCPTQRTFFTVPNSTLTFAELMDTDYGYDMGDVKKLIGEFKECQHSTIIKHPLDMTYPRYPRIIRAYY